MNKYNFLYTKTKGRKIIGIILTILSLPQLLSLSLTLCKYVHSSNKFILMNFKSLLCPG